MDKLFHLEVSAFDCKILIERVREIGYVLLGDGMEMTGFISN